VKGENGLVTWLWLPWLWMLATIALIVFGFAPRLREYR
jgi:putative exporter of polyketide antibiotics